jgi:acyl-CoA thioester hydrolase
MSRFTIALSPRICETDIVGHINNVAIAAWFEDLRVRYMRSFTGSEREGGIGDFTLASVTIDFIGETHYGTDVMLIMQDVTLGTSSITLEGELHQHGKLTARGKAVMVHWDTQTRKPLRIPDSYREQLDDLQNS